MKNKEERIRTLIMTEMNLHPEAKLQDYCKLLYQALYGPSHIIKSEHKAKNYLREELTNSKKFAKEPYQKIYFEKDFIRLNLFNIKNGLIDFKSFFAVFIESSKLKINKNKIDWKKEWELFYNNLVKLNKNVEDSKNYKNLEDQPLVHHSSKYRESYKPHYRVISHSILKKEGIKL